MTKKDAKQILINFIKNEGSIEKALKDGERIVFTRDKDYTLNELLCIAYDLAKIQEQVKNYPPPLKLFK